MIDWIKRLRRASFRGVPFWVEYDDLSGGKRLAIHEVAGGRAPVIEEMGLKVRGIEVTAYLSGEAIEARSAALIAAMQADGPGRLMMPFDLPLLAHAEDFRRSREKDRMGYIAFDLRFVPASEDAGTALSLGDVSASVASGLAAAALAFSAFF